MFLEELDWQGGEQCKLAQAGMFGQVLLLHYVQEDRYDIYRLGWPGQETKYYDKVEPLMAQSILFDALKYSPWAWWRRKKENVRLGYLDSGG